MRSKTTHAVWSGVGEFAARESESAKCKPPGKNDWRSSTPQFSPENFGSPGFFVSGGERVTLKKPFAYQNSQRRPKPWGHVVDKVLRRPRSGQSKLFTTCPLPLFGLHMDLPRHTSQLFILRPPEEPPPVN